MDKLVRISKTDYDVLWDSYSKEEQLCEFIIKSGDCPDDQVRAFVMKSIMIALRRHNIRLELPRLDKFNFSGVSEIPFYNFLGYQGDVYIDFTSDLGDTDVNTFLWMPDTSGGHISHIPKGGTIHLSTSNGEFAEFCQEVDNLS